MVWLSPGPPPGDKLGISYFCSKFTKLYVNSFKFIATIRKAGTL